MTERTDGRGTPDPWRWAGYWVVLAAALVAARGARPFTGGWNDGSRFAAVESLAERGTFVIDDSVFVRPPQPGDGRPTPYPRGKSSADERGTLDKLYIDGHFYSDKSPVPSVLMAGLYRGWLAFGGPTAAERPALFCYLMTLFSSGLAYVLAVECVRRLARAVGLTGWVAVVFTFGFAAATVAPAYSRHVNPNILFLAAAAGLCLALARPDPVGRWRPVAVGTLAGFGYTLDLGIGPALLAVLGPAIVVRYRRVWPVLAVALAAAPWVAAHHVLNYAVGGTLAPANAVPEYLNWPGSPFDATTMTGGLKHAPYRFVVYAFELLFGQKGFILHNLPLLLAPGGAVLLLVGRPSTRWAAGFAAAWAGLGWLLYSATSTNYSGGCCSVRWFVPYLAPGFWVVGLLLREYPTYRADFCWLTAAGCVLGQAMWRNGTWGRPSGTLYWVTVGVALVGWGVVRAIAAWRGRVRAAAVGPAVVLPGPSTVTPRSISAA